MPRDPVTAPAVRCEPAHGRRRLGSITDGYWDIGGTWHPTDRRHPRAPSRRHGRRRPRRPARRPPPMWFVRARARPPPWHDPCDLRARGRHDAAATSTPLPPDLPLGYHDLAAARRRPDDPADRRAPAAAPLPDAGVGLGGPALRRSLARQLGHRRPRRPARPRAAGRASLGAGVLWSTRCTPPPRPRPSSRARTTRRSRVAQPALPARRGACPARADRRRARARSTPRAGR